ncbi:MAG: nucleotide exchange factor GrpE [Campylobacterota bacterium]|nr:nucleotide exchange factor GrpE [Campylobacterota bacterium]
MSDSQEEEPLRDESEEQAESASQDERVEELEGDLLVKAQEEAAEWKDKYLRAHADFENTKKRFARDKTTAISYANESFAKDILAVLDSFDQAIASIESVDAPGGSEVLEKVKEGVSLTHDQLKKVLEKNHIREISCEGEYDPNLHQAIMQVESDEHEGGQVVQVMQKGYTIRDRVLRPAMVSTSK